MFWLKNFITKYHLDILMIFLLILCFPLIEFNLTRSIVLIGILSFSYYFLKKGNNSFEKSLILILIVSFFNFTLQLDFPPFNNNSYVLGYYINYLVPTFHIIDLFVIITIFITFFKFGFIRSKQTLFFLLLFFVWAVVQFCLKENIIILFNALRISLYIYVSAVIVINRKAINFPYLKQHIKLLIIPLLINLFVSVSQIFLNKSLGVNFIGESVLNVSDKGIATFIESGNQIIRAYGTFPHPNVLSGFSLIFLIYFIEIKEKRIFTIISIILILLTGTRVIILITTAYLLIILIIYTVKYFKKHYFIYLLPLFNRFDIQKLFTNDSYIVRIKQIQETLRIIKENFIFGTGIGNYIVSLENKNIYTNSGYIVLEPVHNTLLLIVSEIGLFSVIFFLYLFKSYLYLLKIFEKNKYILFKFSIIYLIIGMFEHYLWSLPQGLILLIFVGIVLPLTVLNNKKIPEKDKTKKPRIAEK